MIKYFLTCFLFISSIVYANDKKIALIFILESNPQYGYLWNEWENDHRYNIYIASKNTIDSWMLNWMKKHVINIQYDYCSRMMLVEKEILKIALYNESNYKFAILNEYNYPIYSSDYIYDELCRDGKTHVYDTVINRQHAELFIKNKPWDVICDQSDLNFHYSGFFGDY